MGRRGVERERFWREVVAAQRRSGSSVRAFCEERGVAENSFYRWRRELRRQDGEADGNEADGNESRPARRRSREGRAREGESIGPERRSSGVDRNAIASGPITSPRRGSVAVEPRAMPASIGVPAFAAVTVSDGPGDGAGEAASSVLEIELAGGDRLRVPGGFDAGTLRAVLESLRGASC